MKIYEISESRLDAQLAVVEDVLHSKHPISSSMFSILHEKLIWLLDLGFIDDSFFGYYTFELSKLRGEK